MKEETYLQLVSRILSCQDCCLGRIVNKKVVGSGNKNANVMFIGEASGRNEDLQGLPFVGQAGKLLIELIEGIGLSRKEVYITNLIKCRPPNNRAPFEDEKDACWKFLLDQIQFIQPKIIVTLGVQSFEYLFRKIGRKMDDRITKIHGKIIYSRGNRIIPMLHPAAGLRKTEYLEMLRSDFKILKVEMEKDGY